MCVDHSRPGAGRQKTWPGLRVGVEGKGHTFGNLDMALQPERVELQGSSTSDWQVRVVRERTGEEACSEVTTKLLCSEAILSILGIRRIVYSVRGPRRRDACARP